MTTLLSKYTLEQQTEALDPNIPPGINYTPAPLPQQTATVDPEEKVLIVPSSDRDDQLLLDFAKDNREMPKTQDVQDALNSVGIRENVFRAGLKLAQMKTIAKLSNNLNTIEDRMSELAENALPDDLVKIHERLQKSLQNSLEKLDGKLNVTPSSKFNSVQVSQTNITNQQTVVNNQSESIVNSKHKRQRVIDVFETLLDLVDE